MSKTKGIGLSGFVKVETQVVRRIVARISGMEKSGKTHFSLTAPAPIAYFELDRNLEGVGVNFVGKKDIYSKSYRELDPSSQDEHEHKWEMFKADYMMAVEAPEIRTIIIDTDTEVYEMVRLAKLGRLTNVMPYQYGPVNKEMRHLVESAKSTDKNFIFIGKMKKMYVDAGKKGEATWNGEWERAGFHDMRYVVQCNLQTFQAEDNEFGIRVIDCGLNGGIRGEELIGDMCNFLYLGMTVYEDTQLGDWE